MRQRNRGLAPDRSFQPERMCGQAVPNPSDGKPRPLDPSTTAAFRRQGHSPSISQFLTAWDAEFRECEA